MLLQATVLFKVKFNFVLAPSCFCNTIVYHFLYDITLYHFFSNSNLFHGWYYFVAFMIGGLGLETLQ